ncbi:MAG: Hpt domain-containing protein [Micropruina sp.]
MTAPDAAIADVYQRLAQRAWHANRARVGELTAVLAEWRRRGELSAGGLDHGRAVAHSLRGSAAIFGHGEAAEAAGSLEELLVGQAPPRLDVAADLVERINRALQEPPTPAA